MATRACAPCGANGVFWDLFGVRALSVDGLDGMGGSYHLDCYDH